MNTITAQKPLEEIGAALKDAERIYIVGCGTCATVCHTGGKSEVKEMKARLEGIGKTVTGWMVIPTACDDMTREALEEEGKRIEESSAILAMTCGFGVQTLARFAPRPVYPALNTLFIGREETPGRFTEVCSQCGECLLAWTGGICPLTWCAKGLLNGPCGGSSNGKCEVDPERDCAWALIHERLKAQGRLDLLEEYRPPRNFQAVLRPGRITLKLGVEPKEQ